MTNVQLFENILVIFFRHQLKIKLFHFQTKCYSAHKASDSYLGKFEENLDKFMEVAQGFVGRLTIKKMTIHFNALNDDNIIEELGKFRLILKMFDKLMANNTELLNIRDEMLGDVEQFTYLLTFK